MGVGFTATEGGANPSAQTLGIFNMGGGTLNWSVSEPAGWLALTPTIGSSTGETNNVTVAVDITGLAAGTHTTTITITDPDAANTPQVMPVSLAVNPAPAPAPPPAPAPGNGCFIATAAYGTPMAEEVEVLSRFGDEHLLTNELGRRFVSLYYQHSPTLAEYISDREWAKRIVRIALLPLVRIAEFMVGEEEKK